jgi:hypothetical protein
MPAFPSSLCKTAYETAKLPSDVQHYSNELGIVRIS